MTEIDNRPLTAREGLKMIAMIAGAFLFMTTMAFLLAACWAGDTAYHYRATEVRASR